MAHIIDLERRSGVYLPRHFAVPGSQSSPTWSAARERNRAALKYLVPVGRVLFAAIFLASLPGHFTAASIEFARGKGVPLAELAVPLSGILGAIGALSVMLGYRTRIGAAMLVLFLVPVTVMMHDFWNISDARMAMMQQAMFMKNVSIMGGALLLAYFGGGPVSLDSRFPRVRKAVFPAIRTSHLH